MIFCSYLKEICFPRLLEFETCVRMGAASRQFNRTLLQLLRSIIFCHNIVNGRSGLRYPKNRIIFVIERPVRRLLIIAVIQLYSSLKRSTLTILRLTVYLMPTTFKNPNHELWSHYDYGRKFKLKIVRL